MDFKQNRKKIFGNFWDLSMSGGLNREGTYLKFWLRGEGLITEGVLS